MLYTLAKAREAVKQFVDNGSCNSAKIDQRINEALERLIDEGDYDCLKKMMRIVTRNLSFALPQNVEQILWVDVDGTPARAFSSAYQFLSSGVGDLDYRSRTSIYKDLVDRGDDWPTMFDIPESYDLNGVEVDATAGMRIVAFSTEDTDAALRYRAQGMKSDRAQVVVDGDFGEELGIYRWQGGVEGSLSGVWPTAFPLSTTLFTSVTRIVKPVTRGYVSLFAVDPVTNYFCFLAKYAPNEQVPQFRRYAITNKTVGSASVLLALVKMRHVELSHEDDVLPLDSLQALKLMVIAISRENAGDLNGAVAYSDQAAKVMGKRDNSRTMTNGTPVILNQDYRTSLGRAMNRGIIL